MILWWSSKLFTLQCQRTCGNHTVDISGKGWLPLRPKRQRNSGAVCSPVWFASHHSSPSSQRRKHFCLAPLWKNRTPQQHTTGALLTWVQKCAISRNPGSKSVDFLRRIPFCLLHNGMNDLIIRDEWMPFSLFEEFFPCIAIHIALTLRGSWFLLGNRNTKPKTPNQSDIKLEVFGRWWNYSHV